MFEWLAEFDPRRRKLIAIILICISTSLYFNGDIWIWGWVVGVLLFRFSGAFPAEKNGYRW